MRELLEQKDYQILNIDATIIAQRPKMASYIPQMVRNVADVLKIDQSQVNIKATTEEGLGFTGSGEGISAQAICSLLPITSYLDQDFETPEKICGGCEKCRRF